MTRKYFCDLSLVFLLDVLFAKLAYKVLSFFVLGGIMVKIVVKIQS